MANTNAERDDNYVPVILCWDDTNSQTEPLLIDDATGYVLIDFEQVASTTPTIANTRDDNDVPMMTAVTDDANADVQPWVIDTNGKLLVDFDFE